MCVAAGFYLPLRIFSCLTALAFLGLLLLDDENKGTGGNDEGRAIEDRWRPETRGTREEINARNRVVIGRWREMGKGDRGGRSEEGGAGRDKNISPGRYGDEVVTPLIRSRGKCPSFQNRRGAVPELRNRGVRTRARVSERASEREREREREGDIAQT